jgi:TPR repeat protein
MHNVEKAEWYRKAAEAGSALGMFSYATILRGGHGVKANVGESEKWTTKERVASDAEIARRVDEP